MKLINFTLRVISTLLFLFIVSTKGFQHICHHDKAAESIQNEEAEFFIADNQKRNTATLSPRNLKITYNFSYLSELSESSQFDEFYTNTEKALKLAILYFSDLIQIIPKTGNMKWTSSFAKCGLVTVPSVDKLIDKDSDLHLYVSYTNETSSFLAYAGQCRFLKGYGPTHGLVNFNLHTLQNFQFSNQLLFQQFVQVVIHELTHVLGFSKSDIKNWRDSNHTAYKNPLQSLKIRKKNTFLLSTPNVLEFARNYYNCSNLQGVPLENQGPAETIGSHWEMTNLNGELMVSELFYVDLHFSGFTTALLRDTGYYYSVSNKLEENLLFGRGKGCSFILGTCDQSLPEFCNLNQTSICDFDNLSVAVCKQSKYSDAGCPIKYPYQNGGCFQSEENFQNKEVLIQLLGVSFGQQSRCFLSSLSHSLITIQKQGICYSYKCQDENLMIQVGNSLLTCKENNQILTLKGWKGEVSCPNDIQEFCQKKSFCVNNCSKNGYCANSQCHCIQGYSGNDCSKVST